MRILHQHTEQSESNAQPSIAAVAKACATLAIDAINETLWPTRCAICDKPGWLICPECERELPFVETVLACPRCGAPYGHVQCSECNKVMLDTFGLEDLPFAQAASSVLLNEETRRIVTTYKDAGEQRLAYEMALIMTRYVPPSWLTQAPVITYIPASKKAHNRRGFDHTEIIAQHAASLLHLECQPLLARPRSKDQRALSRHARARNMDDQFAVLEDAQAPAAVILIDDVCTTGSTLYSASLALGRAGVSTVYCLTFARA